MSSLLTTFRLLLFLLRTLENASGYFSLISTIKLLPAMGQSCPQFTHEPSSILYFFGMKRLSQGVKLHRKGDLVLWIVPPRGIFFLSNGSISDKWLPTALRNDFLYFQTSGFQLSLKVGFLYSQVSYFMENDTCCFVILLCYPRKNHKLQHPEINFSLVYFYWNFTNCLYYSFQETTMDKSQGDTWQIDRK